MAERTVIPFGPQHPVLPEPIHLDLVLDGEHVIEAIPSLGFVHRGLELLVRKKDVEQMAYIAERICGICSFQHGMGFCQGIETILGLEVPERALFLRTFWAELSRIHSHLLWLGLAADAIGFESLFMHAWRVRELILDVIEETTGGRVIFGVCKVGGVRRDVPADILPRLASALSSARREFAPLDRVAREDFTIRNRFEGVGVLSCDDALRLGAVGPTSRASGIPQDMRALGYAAYPRLRFEPVVETAGDCLARCLVRLREIDQSFDLIRQVLDALPDGPIDVRAKGNPQGETFSRVEQPRGEVVYYIRGSGKKNLDRFRVRTPTFANLPPLLKMLEGCELADVPAIVLSIDPCISCAER